MQKECWRSFNCVYYIRIKKGSNHVNTGLVKHFPCVPTMGKNTLWSVAALSVVISSRHSSVTWAVVGDHVVI